MRIIEEFISSQQEILSMEKDFCRRRKGLNVDHDMREIHSGTVLRTCVPEYGGTEVTFHVKGFQEENLKRTLTIGQVIEVSTRKIQDEVMRGVLTMIRGSELQIHLRYHKRLFQEGSVMELVDSDEDEFDAHLEALKDIRNQKSRLRDILFGLKDCTSRENSPVLEEFNPDLDDSQRAAVTFAQSQNEFCIIHGPPGTGKTTALVEIIRQEVAGRQKVLFSAQSNSAVDNITERLALAGLSVVRLGHPARLTEGCRQHTLEAKFVLQYFSLRELEAQMKLFPQVYPSHSEVGQKYEEEKRDLERMIAKCLEEADVVLGTFLNCGKKGQLKYLKRDHFQLTVIDECSQAKEASCWLVIPRSPKLILAGDYHQLSPTVHNKRVESDLSISLMQRIMKDPLIPARSRVCMLTVQYRMNRSIMQWPNTMFYRDQLSAAPLVADHNLSGLENVRRSGRLTDPVLVLIDTSETSSRHETFSNKSLYNKTEAALVIHHLTALIDVGVRPDQIGVIAPYNSQMKLLASLLQNVHPQLEIKTVDGFQGREKEVIILSLVRANNQGNIGFLSDKRRLNVAITRARRQLVVICDAQFFSACSDLLSSFIKFVKNKGQWQQMPKTVDMSVLELEYNNNN